MAPAHLFPQMPALQINHVKMDGVFRLLIFLYEGF
jgi:hypothetical protein